MATSRFPRCLPSIPIQRDHAAGAKRPGVGRCRDVDYEFEFSFFCRDMMVYKPKTCMYAGFG